MPRRSYIIILLLIVGLSALSAFSQTRISGVVNQYGKVISIDGTDVVTLDDASHFAAGDTVMIIQMKGVGINTNNNAGQFGLRQNAYSVGHYELLIVASVSGNQVYFTADLSKTYEVEGSVQLIRVPGYTNALVTSQLTCQPWDSVSGKGGVLAIVVGNTLELNASINVSGKGFKGGITVPGNGECSEADAAYFNMSFEAGSDSAGYKGEGLASYSGSIGNPLSPHYLEGMGPLFNGGGGGNALHSGGGGGGNYGAGGGGGPESSTCGTAGSVGGLTSYSIQTITTWESEDRIFMGGGGGSGTQYGGDLGTNGGDGGGIVLIIADTLVGNGFGIFANGDAVSGVASASAGGGGAGGSVILDVGGLKDNVLIEAKGGDGGKTNGVYCTGPGGGGGGGIIWYSNPSSWGNATTDVSGGVQGSSLNGSCLGYFGGDGESGTLVSGVTIPLTGFLFNTIFSFASGDIYDTICEGETVPKMLGSLPKGGTSPYNYTWESSNDKVSWSVEASGPTQRDLNLVIPLFDTTYYRRTITDASVPIITDVSKILTIIVQPKIQQNLLSFDTTICYNQTPNAILPVYGTPSGGDGVYTYFWEESADGVNFTDAAGMNTNDIYQPPALTATTYYRRNVYSGKCQDISDTVTITVLPLIGNNSIAADQTLCQGYAFSPLAGTAPTGGDGSYLYQWVESTDSATWSNAYGPGTNQNYAPDTTSATFPGKTYFNRVVYSGPSNTCVDTSNAVTLIQWPKIENNSITADQQICEGETPSPLIGASPQGGDGTYTYLWEQSEDNTVFIAGTESNTLNDYTPASLVDTTYYRRIVFSDVCRDTSLVLSITVDPAIQHYGVNLPSLITDTTICEGQQPATLIPEPTPISGGDGIYNYTWEQSTDGGASWTGTGGSLASYAPGTLVATTWYRRSVASGVCQVTSDTVTVNVLPALTGNTLPVDYAVCDGNASLIDGSTPSSGGDGSYAYAWEQSPDGLSWSTASGSNLQEDYQTPALSAVVYYRRIVISGPAATCQDTTGALRIDILPLPVATLGALDTTICEGESVDLLFQVTGLSGPWDLTYDNGFGTTKTVTINNTSPQAENITPSGSGASVQYSYTITGVTDQEGCTALPADLTGTANVGVDGLPVADAGPDEEICGLTYTLKATTPSFGNLYWEVPAGMVLGDTTAAAAQATVTSQGAYNLIWHVTNGICPDQTDAVSLTFWQEPGMVHAGNDTVLEPGEFSAWLTGMQEDPVVGTLLWTTSGNGIISASDALVTEVSGLDPGDNVFTLKVTNGTCPEKSDDVNITVPSFAKHNYGFSPNGDGINDYFRINGAENVENTLTIFNSDGAVVYRIDNFMHADNQSSEGWGGTTVDLTPLPEGTYYFILDVRGSIGEKLTGFIVLKRN